MLKLERDSFFFFIFSTFKFPHSKTLCVLTKPAFISCQQLDELTVERDLSVFFG